jgi:hypothetical protein
MILQSPFPAMLPHEVRPMTVDFAGVLPAGVTLSGTPTVTMSVAVGTDADPQSHVSGTPAIATVTGANKAVSFTLASLVPGVEYVVDVYFPRSDAPAVAEASGRVAGTSPV